jgi:hypothetical protein
MSSTFSSGNPSFENRDVILKFCKMQIKFTATSKNELNKKAIAFSCAKWE